ncbi:hypothetical protein MSAN_01118600 [Mycena sanguinolenta]|uniref:Secreted protein n=1 Tax=Mycena sanguinolenta TaxID=230812 RepID=A0A8H6YM94_9AGAR|nr:hypothetical protein MSAN_01118600 [Mycena sanguinolenta]
MELDLHLFLVLLVHKLTISTGTQCIQTFSILNQIHAALLRLPASYHSPCLQFLIHFFCRALIKGFDAHPSSDPSSILLLLVHLCSSTVGASTIHFDPPARFANGTFLMGDAPAWCWIALSCRYPVRAWSCKCILPHQHRPRSGFEFDFLPSPRSVFILSTKALSYSDGPLFEHHLVDLTE